MAFCGGLVQCVEVFIPQNRLDACCRTSRSPLEQENQAAQGMGSRKVPASPSRRIQPLPRSAFGGEDAEPAQRRHSHSPNQELRVC